MSNTKVAERFFTEEMRLDPKAFFYFYDHAKKQHCVDSLHFILDAEAFQGLPQPLRVQKEIEYTYKYFSESAPESLNLPKALSEKVPLTLFIYYILIFIFIIFLSAPRSVWGAEGAFVFCRFLLPLCRFRFDIHYFASFCFYFI